jgi:hypothetical protein
MKRSLRFPRHRGGLESDEAFANVADLQLETW